MDFGFHGVHPRPAGFVIAVDHVDTGATEDEDGGGDGGDGFLHEDGDGGLGEEGGAGCSGGGAGCFCGVAEEVEGTDPDRGFGEPVGSFEIDCDWSGAGGSQWPRVPVTGLACSEAFCEGRIEAQGAGGDGPGFGVVAKQGVELRAFRLRE